MKPRNILSLTREEKLKFLNSFDHVFSDIDGVVWNLSQSIEGASAGFKELRQAGKHLTFITNNSVRSEAQCLQKLHSHGIYIEPDNLVHPAKSIVEYLNNIKFEGLIYILAAEEFRKVLRQAGYKLLEGPNVVIEESFVKALNIIVDKEPVKAVIIDYDFNMSFLKMSKASYYLKHPDCLLIGGATDHHLPISSDLTLLGPGPFTKILAQTSHKEVVSFGKPGKALAQLLLQRCHIASPERVLMIGDMIEQDVCFATSCGFQSLLVLSGGCSHDKLMTQTIAEDTPDYYAQSMADFVTFMKDINKSNV